MGVRRIAVLLLVATLATSVASCAHGPRDAKPTPRPSSLTPSPALSAATPLPVPIAVPGAPIAATVPRFTSSTTPASSTTPTTSAPAAPEEPRWLGFYIPDVPVQIAPLASVESKTGQFAEVAHYFLGVPAEPFASSSALNAAAMGATPMITLEFWDYHQPSTNQPAYNLRRIAGGAYDDYLRQFARDAADFGSPIWLRPMHEMNGSWYPWCGTVNGNSPADFNAAWRHIYDVFHQEGADNVKFVWCPEATSSPNTPNNAIARYWPGDDYVDYVALDGYNMGTHGVWRSFGSIFRSGYATVTRMTAKPLFIAETGCAETGGDKAAWIADMFRELASEFPRARGVVWFDALKEHDWRINSSNRSLAAFRRGAHEWLEVP